MEQKKVEIGSFLWEIMLSCNCVGGDNYGNMDNSIRYRYTLCGSYN